MVKQRPGRNHRPLPGGKAIRHNPQINITIPNKPPNVLTGAQAKKMAEIIQQELRAGRTATGRMSVNPPRFHPAVPTMLEITQKKIRNGTRRRVQKSMFIYVGFVALGVALFVVFDPYVSMWYQLGVTLIYGGWIGLLIRKMNRKLKKIWLVDHMKIPYEPEDWV